MWRSRYIWSRSIEIRSPTPLTPSSDSGLNHWLESDRLSKQRMPTKYKKMHETNQWCIKTKSRPQWSSRKSYMNFSSCSELKYQKLHRFGNSGQLELDSGIRDGWNWIRKFGTAVSGFEVIRITAPDSKPNRGSESARIIPGISSRRVCTCYGTPSW